MLLQNLNLLTSDPALFAALLLAIAIALLVGITVHEFSHALVASRLGDGTAQRAGRLSLNPVRHLDPAGTLLLFIAGFGWGKPVPVDARSLRGNPRTSMAMVALAGPASNVVAAFLVGALFRAEVLPSGTPLFTSMTDTSLALLASLAMFIIFINAVLALFNLLPLWPLDGFNVVLGALPEDSARGFARLQPAGPVILLGIILADVVLRLGVLSTIIGIPIEFLVGAATG